MYCLNLLDFVWSLSGIATVSAILITRSVRTCVCACVLACVCLCMSKFFLALSVVFYGSYRKKSNGRGSYFRLLHRGPSPSKWEILILTWLWTARSTTGTNSEWKLTNAWTVTWFHIRKLKKEKKKRDPAYVHGYFFFFFIPLQVWTEDEITSQNVLKGIIIQTDLKWSWCGIRNKGVRPVSVCQTTCYLGEYTLCPRSVASLG